MKSSTPMMNPAHEKVRDLRIARAVALNAPNLMFDELPLGDERTAAVLRDREGIARILEREDDRLLVVVGPCSVHDPSAALDYAARLAALAGDLDEHLLIAMRVYFEKPRTTVGWKGLINDPKLDGSYDVNRGLRIARELLLAVLDTGLAVGCEFLDPITPQYIADTVSWGAIGARTTESQTHRQLASGLSMPVGFKNRTDGDIQVAVDAVRAAAVAHAFAGIDDAGAPAILHTAGNRDCHVILRGGSDAPNFGPEDVAGALELLRSAGLEERLVIDASHDNSGKDPGRQADAAEAIADQVAGGNRAINGVMLESFIVSGRQDLGPADQLVYGQSVTDACLDWERTATLLDRLAEAAAERRDAG